MKKRYFFILLITIGIIISFLWFWKTQKTKEKFIQKDNNKQELVEIIRERLPEEKVKEFKLERLVEKSGIKGLNETDQYVEEIEAVNTKSQISEEQISNYQTYVTPNDPVVQEVAKQNNKNIEKIYQAALNWVWIEDEILNQTTEKWLSPKVFLKETPNFATSPVKGKIASDCESQAYSLVSVLRAAGIKPENIRVVTGKVNFGRIVGGHAWVEIYDENNKIWFQLEPTSGNFYDSEKKQLIESSGFPFDYFKSHTYPSLVIWTMFNDKYFYDLTREQGVIPENWLDKETIQKQDDKSNLKYEIPLEIQELRKNKAKKLQDKINNFNSEDLKNNLLKLKKQYIYQSNTSANLSAETKSQIEQKTREIQQLVQGGITNEEWSQIQTDLTNALKTIESMVMQGMTEEQKQLCENYLKQLENVIEESAASNENKQKALDLIKNLENTLATGLSYSQKIQIIALMKELEKIILSSPPPSQENIKKKIEEGISDQQKQKINNLRENIHK